MIASIIFNIKIKLRISIESASPSIHWTVLPFLLVEGLVDRSFQLLLDLERFGQRIDLDLLSPILIDLVHPNIPFYFLEMIKPIIYVGLQYLSQNSILLFFELIEDLLIPDRLADDISLLLDDLFQLHEIDIR